MKLNKAKDKYEGLDIEEIIKLMVNQYINIHHTPPTKMILGEKDFVRLLWAKNMEDDAKCKHYITVECFNNAIDPQPVTRVTFIREGHELEYEKIVNEVSEHFRRRHNNENK